MSRSAEKDIEQYVDRILSANEISASVHAPLGGILVKQTGWLNVNAFINAMQTYLQKQKSFITDKIKYKIFHWELFFVQHQNPDY